MLATCSIAIPSPIAGGSLRAAMGGHLAGKHGGNRSRILMHTSPPSTSHVTFSFDAFNGCARLRAVTSPSGREKSFLHKFVRGLCPGIGSQIPSHSKHSRPPVLPMFPSFVDRSSQFPQPSSTPFPVNAVANRHTPPTIINRKRSH